MMMKKVLTYGTFDILHIGHVNLLKRAKELGDYLVVAVSTDEFNELKGKKTIIPFDQRVELVRSIRYVDEVIEETNWEQKVSDVKEHNISVFTIGDDWKGKFDFLKEYCEVVYLERTENISSSILKTDLDSFRALNDHLKNLSNEDIDTFVRVLETVTKLK